MSNALQLFRDGFDYLQIASHLNTTEAEVERQIHRLRQEEIDEAARQKAERIEAQRRRDEEARAKADPVRLDLVAARKAYNAQSRAYRATGRLA